MSKNDPKAVKKLAADAQKRLDAKPKKPTLFEPEEIPAQKPSLAQRFHRRGK